MGVVRIANPSEYGVIELEKDKLNRIREKPKTHMSEGWVNTGIYVLDDAVFLCYSEDTSFEKEGV